MLFKLRSDLLGDPGIGGIKFTLLPDELFYYPFFNPEEKVCFINL